MHPPCLYEYNKDDVFPPPLELVLQALERTSNVLFIIALTDHNLIDLVRCVLCVVMSVICKQETQNK